jgi:hypothetical protein
MDKELEEVREEIDKLMIRMQQEVQGGWKYEWPLNKKARCLVQKLFSRRHQQKLRRWMRHAENLSDTEEQGFHLQARSWRESQ